MKTKSLKTVSWVGVLACAWLIVAIYATKTSAQNSFPTSGGAQIGDRGDGCCTQLLLVNNGEQTHLYSYGPGYGNGGFQIHKYTGGSGPGPVFSISNTGNVGVTPYMPYYRFEIQGSSSRNTLAMFGDGDTVGYAGIKIGALTTTNIADNRTSQFNLHMRKDSWYGGDGSGPSFIIESVSKVGGFAAPFMITPTNNVILNGGTGAYGLSYGNVGIGTTSPGAKLHIEGAGGTPELLRINNGFFHLRDRGDGYGAQFRMTAGNSQWDIYNQASNGAFHIYQLTNSGGGGVYTDRLFISQDGKVGINKDNPSYMLDVNGAINSSSGGLCIAGDCKTAWSQVSGGGTSSASNVAAGQFGANTGGGTYAFPSSVNVNGGSSSNWAGLNVGGTASINAAGNIYSYSRICVGNNSGNCDSANGVVIAGSGSNAFGNVYLTGSGNSYFNGGNVGIGTTNPARKLDINLGGTNDGLRILSGSTANYPYIQLGRATAEITLSIAAGPGYFASNAVAGDVVLRTEGSSQRLLLNSGTGDAPLVVYNGNVGIGTTSPVAKLDVNGSINVSGNINAKYQDVAEWVPSSERLSAGTVVVLDTTKSNQVISSTVSYDTRVAGVISAQPGIVLGEKSDNKVLVATTGRVRVKVDATKSPISIGDLLVTSDVPGLAMKSEAVNLGGVQIHRPGTLIGKALEPLEKGSGKILVLLSLQ